MSQGFGNLFSSSSENQSVKQPKLPSGVHLLAVVAIGVKDSRPPRGRRAEFRFTVLQSTNPDVVVGSEYGDVFFPEDTSQPDTLETNRGRLRALTRAIAGLPVNAEPDEISAAWSEMSGGGQSARGVKLRCTGTDLESKRGNPFVAYIYESVPQTDEDIVETRRQIDNASVENKAAESMKASAPVPPGIAARLAAVGK